MAEPRLQYFEQIRRTYGIDVLEFLDLFASQGHRCAICLHQLWLFSDTREYKPVVDHCHATGRVRGILCHSCNLCVGWIEKDFLRTKNALNYVKQQGKFKPKSKRCRSPEAEEYLKLVDLTRKDCSDLKRAIIVAPEED